MTSEAAESTALLPFGQDPYAAELGQLAFGPFMDVLLTNPCGVVLLDSSIEWSLFLGWFVASDDFGPRLLKDAVGGVVG